MTKKKISNLIVEHVTGNANMMMLSLLEHRHEQYLVIVDNITEDELTAYVLDFAQQEGVDLEAFINVAGDWEQSGVRHPLSFELSKLGLSEITQPIYKTFALAHVRRLVGRGFSTDLRGHGRIKRRRVPVIPEFVEIRPKATIYALQRGLVNPAV
jgi:hypothetical protein